MCQSWGLVLVGVIVVPVVEVDGCHCNSVPEVVVGGGCKGCASCAMSNSVLNQSPL